MTAPRKASFSRPYAEPHSGEKREELQTYRELKLLRTLKSERQRRRIQGRGLERILGDGSLAYPFLLVNAARYRVVRLQIQRRLLIEARDSHLDLSVDLLLEQLRPRIEALTYEQLGQEIGRQQKGNLPVASIGRLLTPEELARFTAAEMASEPATGGHRESAAQRALNQTLGQIESRQQHNPARHQACWAQIVGSDAAQQSFLDQIDPGTQTAWFRCYNSVLSSHLQRRPGLAQKLGKLLGIPLRQLRARF